MKLKKLLVYAIILATMLVSGCGSLEEAVQEAKKVVPGDWEVIHTQEVQNEANIVFYINNDELGSGLFQKDAFGWKWLGTEGGSLVTHPKGLSWRYASLGDKTTKYYLYYGFVEEPKISEIEVKTTWGEVTKAKIVQSGDYRLWYSLISKDQVPSVDADITGYSKEGKAIYLFSQPKQGSSK
ncbi:Lipoprotein Rz1 precursor [Desulfitobacterium dichloroeliminans LMG P-21439]|uniref:Lipoprotein Rz1 n=1 Tax=Desulfitobacterium dichloroeliminans (strain LMG P-21439 / DCA1) TaxID=871963 RepID=L0FD55_DESDL|nr:hypothetical protein [Desulfitobacterium dichloroeliminans]AGA70883.1 Lipoprotein Rz1 precursor [Desulfitobacterium dichloroeliminans LMG P-21439]